MTTKTATKTTTTLRANRYQGLCRVCFCDVYPRKGFLIPLEYTPGGDRFAVECGDKDLCAANVVELNETSARLAAEKLTAPKPFVQSWGFVATGSAAVTRW
jgi:hypothetical protein